MARTLLVVSTALLLGVTAAGLAACGQDQKGKLLTPQEASDLTDSLDRVDTRFISDDCEGAQSALASAELDADSLSEDVDQDLRDALDSSLNQLRELLNDECKTETTETETTTTETKTTETETIPTETETVPTETETIPTPTETTPTIPDGDAGPGPDDGGIEPPPGDGGTPGTP